MDAQEVGRRIKIARTKRGLTLDDIAASVGLVKSTIQRYEAGKITTPKVPVVEAIANALSVDPVWLSGKDVPMEPEFMPTYSNITPIRKKAFPLFDGIAAGEPILMPDGVECYVDVTTEIKADFAIRVHGDSMIGARINDGDIVFVRSQPNVENGEIAAVAIDDEATLKRVYCDRESGIVSLAAENPKYPPMVFTAESGKEVKILGKAIAFQSDVK